MTDLNPADLRLVSHTTSDGVTTREFVLGEVTAALWVPEHAAPGTPLVLLGHGGGSWWLIRGYAARLSSRRVRWLVRRRSRGVPVQ